MWCTNAFTLSLNRSHLTYCSRSSRSTHGTARANIFKHTHGSLLESIPATKSGSTVERGVSLRSMAVLSSWAQERRSSEKNKNQVASAPISSRFLCSRPPLLLSAPNQNRHATQANVVSAVLLQKNCWTSLTVVRCFSRFIFIKWFLYLKDVFSLYVRKLLANTLAHWRLAILTHTSKNV